MRGPDAAKVEILLGLECEWSPDHDSYLRGELLARRGVEYLVSGTHYYLKDGAWEDSAAIHSASGLFAYARHVLAAVAAAHIPAEINGYGMRKPRVESPEGSRWPYPHLEFWDLAREYDLEAIVNSDAHRPMDVAAGLGTGKEMAALRGLSVVESLRIPLSSSPPGQ